MAPYTKELFPRAMNSRIQTLSRTLNSGGSSTKRLQKWHVCDNLFFQAQCSAVKLYCFVLNGIFWSTLSPFLSMRCSNLQTKNEWIGLWNITAGSGKLGKIQYNKGLLLCIMSSCLIFAMLRYFKKMKYVLTVE